ncbi:MAG: 16S rRNA (cytidine(1402)-2'-O)-methyltransferase [Roseibacillus sp.]
MSDESNPAPLVSFVPTPIGNLGDITLRAIETLRAVDLIACEDTRHSRKLLNHLEIEKPLVSLHDHNEKRRAPELVAKAKTGKRIAVISDAGTPCLSDPGHRFMRALIEAEVPYEVLPGACAITTALVSSGFPPHPFTFGGFLPFKKGKRERELQAALERGHTSVYFESPHRLVSTLEILSKLNPKVRLCITRELTKKFENIYGGETLKLLKKFTDRPPRGELALVLDPNIPSQ